MEANINPSHKNSERGKITVLRIGDLLLERGLITQEQIDQALAYQKEHRPKSLLGRILVDLDLITAENLVATMAVALGVPFKNLTPEMIDSDALEILPHPFIKQNNVLPISLADNQFTIAMEEFTNVFLIENIERLSGYAVQVVAATNDNIRQVIQSCLSDSAEYAFDEIIDEVREEGELTVVEQKHETVNDLESAASDSPVIKLVNHIINGAIHERASDIHIEPDDGVFRVRYRVDGELHEVLQPPPNMLSAVVSRIKIMAGMDIAERRIPQDGGITVMLKKNPVDLRVSTMPTKYGEKVVIRVINNKGASLNLRNLGFSETMLPKMLEILSEKNGVILVTGPTGSGKSTTLYGSLNEIVTPKINVSTIEDPIEYNLARVNQFQVNTKAGFTFARALRALLRQDPDVIMVGEIRDPETAQIATQAALTGHLVLSTLHTNDAPSAVPRLINMEVEPYLVAASLRGVLAQRLVRKICTNCKVQADLQPTTLEILKTMFGGSLPMDTFYEGKGCSQCRNTGCAGRIAIYELFVPEQEMLEAIGRNASIQELRRTSNKRNYTTLRQDGIEKAKQGIISINALLEVVARRGPDEPEETDDGNAEVWHPHTREDD